MDNPNLKAMKTVLRVMPFVILPLTINFPTVRDLISPLSLTSFSFFFSCFVSSVRSVLFQVNVLLVFKVPILFMLWEVYFKR